MKSLNARIRDVLQRNRGFDNLQLIRSTRVMEVREFWDSISPDVNTANTFTWPQAHIWLRMGCEEDAFIVLVEFKDNHLKDNHNQLRHIGYRCAIPYVGSNTECEIAKRILDLAVAKHFMTRG